MKFLTLLITALLVPLVATKTEENRRLSLEHARILPISDEVPLLDYSHTILDELRLHQVRAELDASTDYIEAKIANAEQMKVHTMFVIDNRDMEANAVSIRVHGKGNLGAKLQNTVIAAILESIRTRQP